MRPKRGLRPGKRDEAARAVRDRRDHPERAAIGEERKQSGPVGMADLVVRQRTVVARDIVQRFERKPQRCRERDHIGILTQRARRYQDAFGADVEFLGARFGGGKESRRQPMPQAVQFGTRRKCLPRRVAADAIVRTRISRGEAVIQPRPARDASALLASYATQHA